MGYRCETWQPTSRPGQRSADRGVQGREVRPRRGGLERLHHHAAVEQVVAQVRAVEARARPALARLASAEAAAGGPQHPDRVAAPRRVLPPQDHQAASADTPAHDRAGARERERVARLVLVQQPRHLRRQARLLELPQRLAAGVEAGQQPALVALLGGDGMHPQRGRGDHAEDALAPGDELPQLRPGGARGRIARGQLAERRRAAHGDEVLVDPPAPGRELAGGAGGDAAADRGPLVALGQMREPQTVGARARGRPPAAADRAQGWRSGSAGRPR